MFRYLTLLARLCLGLCFVVFGMNGLTAMFMGKGFLPLPPPSQAMIDVMTGFFKAGYLMPLVKGLELVGGLFLIIGRYQRLVLILLTPIVVNIVGLHLFVEPSALPMSAFLIVSTGVLIHSEWKGGFDQLLKS